MVAILTLTGCSDTLEGLTCDDVADEAVRVSDGDLIKIADRQLVSQSETEVVCRGTGVYARGPDTPTRFRYYIDDEGDEMVKYDSNEYQQALISQQRRRAEVEADRAQRAAEREYERMTSQAGM